MGVINNVLMCKWDKTLSLALFFVRNSQVNKYVFDYTNMFAPYTVFVLDLWVFSQLRALLAVRTLLKHFVHIHFF